MSCAMRSTSARSCRQVASSFIRSLARTSALYSSLWPSNRPSSPAFWSITASSSRVGQQEPRPPEQVLAHHDLRPAVRPGQRRGLGRTPLVDLERDEATGGLEQPACAGEEGTGHGQPVPAAHQRLARLEQPHAGIETRVLGVREIRGVRHDRAQPRAPPERRQQVALAHLHRHRRAPPPPPLPPPRPPGGPPGRPPPTRPPPGPRPRRPQPTTSWPPAGDRALPLAPAARPPPPALRRSRTPSRAPRAQALSRSFSPASRSALITSSRLPSSTSERLWTV